MEFKSTIVVVGAKSSKGDYQGKPYDNTKLFYQTDLQEGENFAGSVSAEIRWGEASNFQKIKDLSYPFIADVTMKQVSNGKDQSMIILDLVPQKQPVKA